MTRRMLRASVVESDKTDRPTELLRTRRGRAIRALDLTRAGTTIRTGRAIRGARFDADSEDDKDTGSLRAISDNKGRAQERRAVQWVGLS